MIHVANRTYSSMLAKFQRQVADRSCIPTLTCGLSLAKAVAYDLNESTARLLRRTSCVALSLGCCLSRVRPDRASVAGKSDISWQRAGGGERNIQDGGVLAAGNYFAP